MSKQYMVVCDEAGVLILSRILSPNLVQFVEVQGMATQDGKHNLLVTPIPQSIEPGEPNGADSASIQDGRVDTTELDGSAA